MRQSACLCPGSLSSLQIPRILRDVVPHLGPGGMLGEPGRVGRVVEYVADLARNLIGGRWQVAGGNLAE